MAETTKRIVVVTGGSRGIGRSICISMAGADTHIYFNYFNPGNPDEEAEKAKETESAVIEAGDVRTPDMGGSSSTGDFTKALIGAL